MENSNSQDDMQCVPGAIERASSKATKKKPRFKITPTRRELEKKKNEIEKEDSDAILEVEYTISLKTKYI